MTPAEKIQKIKDEKHLTNYRVSRELDVAQHQISKWLSGGGMHISTADKIDKWYKKHIAESR